MNKFVPCEKCSNGFIINKSGGYAVKCECLKEYQSIAKVDLGLYRAGIEEFNLSFSDYRGTKSLANVERLKKYCNEIQSTFLTGSHLYLYGPNGTQKSTLAKIILKSCIEKKFSGKFILMSDLLDILTDVFSDDPKRKSELTELQDVDILVIDDAFDKNKITLYKSGWQQSFVDRFIRSRIEISKKNTIFTSNIPIDDIPKNGFTEDIKNLLQRSIKVRQGELYFNDVWVEEELDISSLWD